MRQLLTESVLLAVFAGALGALLSPWMLGALVHYLPQEIPRGDQITVDGQVLFFVLAISVFTGIVFGAAPAWRASRLDPLSAMRDMGRGATAGRARSRLQNWIVIGETAIGLVLLAGSGLLIRSFLNILRIDPGFDPHHVLTAHLSLPDRLYGPQEKVRFYEKLISRLRCSRKWNLSLPGSRFRSRTTAAASRSRLRESPSLPVMSRVRTSLW
jgi:putative ABC transport system permease protein